MACLSVYIISSPGVNLGLSRLAFAGWALASFTILHTGYMRDVHWVSLLNFYDESFIVTYAATSLHYTRSVFLYSDHLAPSLPPHLLMIN